MDATKKITKATVKSFIRKNEGNLFINVKSSFDGTVDGSVTQEKGFEKAQKTDECLKNSLGIDGAWFVNGSRDYFRAFENDNFEGIEVYNSCGCFILAVKKQNESKEEQPANPNEPAKFKVIREKVKFNEEKNYYELLPLEEYPLSTQLMALTGDSYNTLDFINYYDNGLDAGFGNIINHKKSGFLFKIADRPLKGKIFEIKGSFYKVKNDYIAWVVPKNNKAVFIEIHHHATIKEITDTEIIVYLSLLGDIYYKTLKINELNFIN